MAVAKLVNADLTSLLRFEAGDTMTLLAEGNAPDLMAPGGLTGADLGEAPASRLVTDLSPSPTTQHP